MSILPTTTGFGWRKTLTGKGEEEVGREGLRRAAAACALVACRASAA